MRICLLLMCALSSAWAEMRSYEGYSVYRITPETEEQVPIVKSLETQYDTWKECLGVGDPCDFLIDPDRANFLGSWLQAHDLEFYVMIPNVETVIQQQFEESLERHSQAAKGLRDFEYNVYHTLAQIEEWMVDIEKEFPELISSFKVADSFEGRDIKMFKLSTGGSDKPAIWLDGAIHSREWVSPAMVIWFVNQLASEYTAGEQEVSDLLDACDIYILPVFNVDGYEYTWTDNRLWRKTRSENKDSDCMGCDPNRNWDIRWNEIGTSSNPCSDLFAGPSAFSEIEVRNVSDYVATIPNLKAYLAYHSYGQMYMSPYGYQTQQPPDFDDLMEACERGNAALYAVHGMTYRCDTLIGLVGPNSGSSADWTYAVPEIKYSFGVELRDQGQYGFLLPADQIVPTAEENWAFFKEFAKHVLDLQ